MEIIKIRAEIHEIETRETIENIRSKVGSLKRSRKLTNFWLSDQKKKLTQISNY